ncbi:MAG TPA: tetratricopeptide repeat protein [Rudaea sp.]|jgi:TolB-like protein/Tfp pilus assembly protein PilF
MSLIAELKRRKVFKVGAAYLVAAWLVVQAASIGFPAFDAPPWVLRVFILVALLGFPVALVLAWSFDLTPAGVKVDASAQGSKRMLAIAAALVLLALAWYFTGQPAFRRGDVASVAAQGSLKSIAVLPFENLSHDPDNAYFAQGIQDEILTRLAKIGDLKVISRTSTEKYKSAPDNLRQIAAELGVANILEGSVQRANDQVRVNVQLISALNDAHLWADIYDRKLTDIFAVESDVATSIAGTLQAKLSGSEQRALSARPTENTEAYQLYLRGRFFWNKRTGDDLRRSIGYFEQAIAKDPNYALAYAALAQAQLLMPGYNGGSPREWFPQAETAAKKALALDETSSDAHAALGMVKQLYDFDSPGAIAEFERAIALNPNDGTAHHWLANHSLAATGQIEREITEMKRALELDPLALIFNANLAQAYIYARRYDDAVAQLRKVVEMDNGFYFARIMLGQALELGGHRDDAIIEYRKVIAQNDDPFAKALLGHALALAGQHDEAGQLFEQLRKAREQRYVEAYGLAIVKLGLGDRDGALDWLERGFEDRDGFDMAVIRTDPYLDSLHGEPRFEALAEKIVPARYFSPAVGGTQ